MPTPEWRQKNAHKSRQYAAKYKENNTVATVVLKPWVIEEINKIKDPSEPIGGWVRKQIEAWAENQRLNAE
ncbi:MAG: hypothetical protein DSM106950_23160 [Stigonema ocellatum SAG 48.90 = DSM 106950]|nr:hypothetical protein [Stigonema ocellatum SAG 48.90 = DSM 106950]